MKLKLFFICFLTGFLFATAKAQPCKLTAEFTSSDISVSPKDPDFRDKAVVNVDVKNTGTCGWEKGKIKLEWELTGSPSKAKSFPKELLSGMKDVKAIVLPGKEGSFQTIDFPWPEYPGLYTFNFWISYNGNDLSRKVKVEINWD
ncbi:MAG TPA: hypothetical protein PLX17_03495 [Chitinophagaceae bacterium]|nr:hypothetical protein [Chitinophagaceae bacterium]